jgi:formate dehydrogenase subunit gamma
MSDDLVRFSVRQRLEHAAMMVLFTVLATTGFPQKFSDSAWAGVIVDALGGIANTRLVHRVSGGLFTAALLIHLAWGVAWLLRRRQLQTTMVPTRKDFADAIGTLRYYLGLSKDHPRFDRYDYRQKFEYWGLIFGSIIMVVTGLVLLFPTTVAWLLPGQVIPASKVAHSNEGVMAFLVVIVWHVYNSILSPEVFPFDTSIFTGKISRERMEREHPLELARREQSEGPQPPPQPDGGEAPEAGGGG